MADTKISALPASTTIEIFRETGGVSSSCPVGATFDFDVTGTYFI